MASELEAHTRHAWQRHGVPEWEVPLVRDRVTGGSIIGAARSTAHDLSMVDREAMRVGTQRIDHFDLEVSSWRLASVLRRRGAETQNRVVIAGPNSVDFVIAYLGALRAGAAVSLAGPMVPPAELVALIDRVGASDVIVSPAFDGALGPHPTPRLTFGPGPHSMADAIRRGKLTRDFPIRTERIAHLMSTSGTTGLPKSVPLAHGNILASVRGIARAWRWTRDDVLVHALPLQHAHGLTAVHVTALTGSRSVVLERFDPDELATTIERERATVLFGVPATHEALLASGALEHVDTSSLRLVVSGSAPLAPRTFDALTAAFGMPPLERYGLTECGFVLSNAYTGADCRTAGSVGWPLPGIEVDIRDAADAETSVPDGADGEIVVRGPQVFDGYLDDPDPGAAWTSDGWFRTGDLGRRDPDTGAVAITGRLKELIITGGLNVYPREVELALEALPGIRAAAVVGVPSERWGEAVTVFVEVTAAIDESAVLTRLRAELAAYKCPKRIVVVDALPRNQLGKILRRELVGR